MTKNRKSFKDWYEEDDWNDPSKDTTFKKRDGKRYDTKKKAIQKARKQKAKAKDSFFT
jgi:hypothetical protein